MDDNKDPFKIQRSVNMKNSQSKKTKASSQTSSLNKNQSYIFVLKEGKLIQENFLDYSLMLLQVTQSEFMPSPSRPRGFAPVLYLDKR